ncbi:hypothetical protein [Microcystis phage Mel-JY01]
MPLFHGKRDARLIHTFSKELIERIIDTEVILYKVYSENSRKNIYEENDAKLYYEPIKISCLISRQEQTYEQENFGSDVSQICDFAFMRERLKDVGTVVDVGDIIEYNGQFWEVDSVVENQYFGGKNPDFSFAGNDWGANISIVANTHLTRKSKLNIGDFRPATSNNKNDIPRNI